MKKIEKTNMLLQERFRLINIVIKLDNIIDMAGDRNAIDSKEKEMFKLKKRIQEIELELDTLGVHYQEYIPHDDISLESRSEFTTTREKVIGYLNTTLNRVNTISTTRKGR